MATQMATAVKKPGPPVPPRPQHTSATASLLKTQRESLTNSFNRATTTTTPTTPPSTPTKPTPPAIPLTKTTSSTSTSSSASSKVTVANGHLEQAGGAAGAQAASPAHPAPPVIHRKPTLSMSSSSGAGGGSAVGRTVIYKSPSLNLQNKSHEEREKRIQATVPLTPKSSAAPKPPLKLRKAPDVPTTKPRVMGNEANCDKIKPNQQENNNNSNNVVIPLQPAANGINLNRHHSMSAPKAAALRDAAPRLSLGRADFDKVGHKIHLDQLQPGLPLPKPRKIVKMPVATLDLDDEQSATLTGNGISPIATTTTATTASSGMSIFRRSKTTLDNLASRGSVSATSTNGSVGSSSGNSSSSSTSNSFLGGKTVELKNNLKNAAERLFSELIVSQQKQSSASDAPAAMLITKHERAIQHHALLLREPAAVRQKSSPPPATPAITTVTLSSSPTSPAATTAHAAANEASNCTRVNISNSNSHSHSTSTSLSSEIENVLKSPEKKTAFHEILISELAAMRAKSNSMENLQTKDVRLVALNGQKDKDGANRMQTPKKAITTPTTPIMAMSVITKTKPLTAPKTATAAVAPTPTPAPTATSTPITNNNKFAVRQRYNSLEDQEDPDTEDVDADNIDDVEGYDDDLTKTLKVVVAASNINTPRKRTPSGCSSDSSPYGTERSARIRTSDWIEVGDNGKQVTMTSCHISLEDSGMEDEERLDDMSSSGVGDSWDSVKEAAQHEKRSRSSVKRVMSITELPPLPKSLSGFNKMLGSDSGLLSDVDVNFETISNSNNNSKLQCQKEQHSTTNNSDSSSNNSNNSSNHNSNICDKNTNGDDNAPTPTTAAGTTAATVESADNASATASEETTTTMAGIATTTATTPGFTLNTQLALLKKEMYGLRQLDLSLLSQLWALNDSIQEFRTMIQEQDEAEADEENDDEDEEEDDDMYTRQSRTPSSYDPESSEPDEEIISRPNKQSLGATPKIITTQPKLRATHSIGELNATPIIAHQRQQQYQLKPQQLSQQQQQKPALPKPLEMRPVPRMRSAPPPPPPNHRKTAAPPRPT